MGTNILTQFLISVGLDIDDFTTQLNRLNNSTEQATKKNTNAIDEMTKKGGNKLLSFAKHLIAPVTGLLTVGSMIKSYFSGVAEVAKLTGAYNPVMDEWRKKRELLQRVNKDDIKLYKQMRESLFKFQMTMADFATKVMRFVSPVIKKFLEILDGFSDWIDRNSNNIIRFVTILVSVLSIGLLPILIKLGAQWAKTALAFLKSPLGAFLVILGAIIVLVDDFVVWLKNGESALSDFWRMFGSQEEVKAKLESLFKFLFGDTAKLQNILKNLAKYALIFITSFAIIRSLITLILPIFKVFTWLKNSILITIAVLKMLFSVGAWVFNGLLIGFRAVASAMLLNPIGLAITLIITALTMLYVKWDQVVLGAKMLCEDLADVVKSLASSIHEKWGDLVIFLGENITKAINKIKNKWNNLKDWFKSSFDKIGELWASLWDKMINVFNSSKDWIKDKFMSIIPDWAIDLFASDEEEQGTKTPTTEQIKTLNNSSVTKKTSNISYSDNRTQNMNITTNNGTMATRQSENLFNSQMSFTSMNTGVLN